LGATGDRRATPHLVHALQDEEVFVQVAAARALGQLGDPSAEVPLRKAAWRSGRGAWLQREARTALDQLGVKSPVRRPPILAWVVGVAVTVASLALVPVVGVVALVGLLAGAGIILGYSLRGMGSRTGPGPTGPGAYYTEGDA
jgi:Flp pilus assembly protein TadB